MISGVIEFFHRAETAQDFRQAERAARRLRPHDQLLVIDALRAAESRLKKAGQL